MLTLEPRHVMNQIEIWDVRLGKHSARRNGVLAMKGYRESMADDGLDRIAYGFRSWRGRREEEIPSLLPSK